MTDVAWTGTGGITDTQSYAWVILNAIYDRLVSTSFFQNFAVKRITEALPLDAGLQIPSLGIFLGREQGTPDGDPNHGTIRFSHEVPIGFQIVIKNNDPVIMQAVLDQAKWFVLNQIFRDDTITNRCRSNLPDNVRFEAVKRLTIPKPVWGLTGSQNETPVGIQIIEMIFSFKTEWSPTEFPDLERVTVRTGFPRTGTPEERAEVQQVTMVYEFNPDSVPYPLPPGTQPPTPFTGG